MLSHEPICFSQRNQSKRSNCPLLCHPEQLTCLRQVEGEMTRPGGPTAKREPSPEGLGNRSRRGSERRRRGTKPIVRSCCVIRRLDGTQVLLADFLQHPFSE